MPNAEKREGAGQIGNFEAVLMNNPWRQMAIEINLSRKMKCHLRNYIHADCYQSL